MPDDPRSVAPALRAFLWSRAAIWLLAVVVVIGFDGALNARRGEWDSQRLHDLGAAIDVWARWDSDWFLQIAEDGYSWPSSTPAFFPLYPLLVAGLGRLLVGHMVLAGVLVSLAAGLAAFVLLYRLTAAHLGLDAARRTVLFLAWRRPHCSSVPSTASRSSCSSRWRRSSPPSAGGSGRPA